MIVRLLPFFLVLFALDAFAAGTVTIQGEGEGEQYTMVIEYLDDQNLRMNFPRQQGEGEGYMLVKDDRVYTVANINNSPMVMDLTEMSKMTAGMGAGAEQDDTSGPMNYEILEMKSTGRSETVAGFKGKVFMVTAKDHEGTHTEEVVLSSDKEIRAYSDAWRKAGRTMEQMHGSGSEGDNDLNRYMEKNKVGLLRYGNMYRVTAVDTNKPAVDRFTLPAPPMAMPDFGSMMNNAGQGSQP